jgi:hypothetical protein
MTSLKLATTERIGVAPMCMVTVCFIEGLILITLVALAIFLNATNIHPIPKNRSFDPM